MFWGGGGKAGGNGEDRDIPLGDLFGPCFLGSAGNVCPWDMRVWEQEEKSGEKTRRGSELGGMVDGNSKTKRHNESSEEN